MPHGHGRCTEIFRPPTAGPVRRGSIMRASFGGVLDRAEGLRRTVSGCKRPTASECRFEEVAGSSISTEYSRETRRGRCLSFCRFVPRIAARLRVGEVSGAVSLTTGYFISFR